jgi:hypothetical protein
MTTEPDKSPEEKKPEPPGLDALNPPSAELGENDVAFEYAFSLHSKAGTVVHLESKIPLQNFLSPAQIQEASQRFAALFENLIQRPLQIELNELVQKRLEFRETSTRTSDYSAPVMRLPPPITKREEPFEE